jgi:hypothetical protein
MGISRYHLGRGKYELGDAKGGKTIKEKGGERNKNRTLDMCRKVKIKAKKSE